jgi:suppressor of fused-like protein
MPDERLTKDAILQDKDNVAAMPAPAAIAAHLDTLYKGRKPRHFATIHSAHPAGQDPLTGVSVWKRAEPVPHWHYVTQGLSQPNPKAHAPGASGFGFELTFRLACSAEAMDAPLWPLDFLHSLARYVFRTSHALQDGHRMNASGPIAPGQPTQLCAMGFTSDPELPAIASQSGSIAFLQVVGLTGDEESAAERWDTRKLLDAFLAHMPMWVTRLERASLLSIPALQVKVRQGAQHDGSSTGVLVADLLDMAIQKRLLRKPLVGITLGALQLAKLHELLPLRLPFGRPFMLSGPAWKLQCRQRERSDWSLEGNVLTLDLSPSMTDALAAALPAREGQYRLAGFDELQWSVKQTAIRNAQGDIVEVIGGLSSS